jgi:hypothetical protein
MAPHAVYAREKLYTAIRILAIHLGNIRERLKGAAFEIVLIPVDGIPDFEGVAEDIAWIKTRLTSKASRFEGEGRIDATLHGMRSTTATHIADRMLTAHAKLDVYVRATMQKSAEPQSAQAALE